MQAGEGASHHPGAERRDGGEHGRLHAESARTPGEDLGDIAREHSLVAGQIGRGELDDPEAIVGVVDQHGVLFELAVCDASGAHAHDQAPQLWQDAFVEIGSLRERARVGSVEREQVSVRIDLTDRLQLQRRHAIAAGLERDERLVLHQFAQRCERLPVGGVAKP